MTATLEVAFAGTLQYATGYTLGRLVDSLFAFNSGPQTDGALVLSTLGQLFVGYGALSEVMRLMVSINGELRSPIGDAVSTTAFFMAQTNLQQRLSSLATLIENRLRLSSGLAPKKA